MLKLPRISQLLISLREITQFLKFPVSNLAQLHLNKPWVGYETFKLDFHANVYF